MPRALVTGITSHDGTFHARFLQSNGREVYGLICGESIRDRQLMQAAVSSARVAVNFAQHNER